MRPGQAVAQENLLVNASGNAPATQTRRGSGGSGLLASRRAGPGTHMQRIGVRPNGRTAGEGQRQTCPESRISILPYKVCVGWRPAIYPAKERPVDEPKNGRDKERDIARGSRRSYGKPQIQGNTCCVDATLLRLRYHCRRSPGDAGLKVKRAI